MNSEHIYWSEDKTTEDRQTNNNRLY